MAKKTKKRLPVFSKVNPYRSFKKLSMTPHSGGGGALSAHVVPGVGEHSAATVAGTAAAAGMMAMADVRAEAARRERIRAVAAAEEARYQHGIALEVADAMMAISAAVAATKDQEAVVMCDAGAAESSVAEGGAQAGGSPEEVIMVPLAAWILVCTTALAVKTTMAACSAAARVAAASTMAAAASEVAEMLAETVEGFNS